MLTTHSPARQLAIAVRARQLLHRLREGLASDVTAMMPTVLRGFGGAGKTQVAIEYVWRFSPECNLVSIVRLPHARSTRTWPWYGRPSPALSPPLDRSGRRPGTRPCGAEPVHDLTGRPVRAGAAGRRLTSGCALPMRACPAPGSLGYQRARNLTGCLVHPRELSAWPGGSGSLSGRRLCGQPLVPTGPQSPVRIFSNHSVLAGAPLRIQTVDLLLTLDILPCASQHRPGTI